MSASPPTPSAQNSASTMLLLCPACLCPFRASDPGAHPQSFACGHVACMSCAEAGAALEQPVCPVCFTATTASFVPNAPLAAFAESCICGDEPSVIPVAAARSVTPQCSLHPGLVCTWFHVEQQRACCDACVQVAPGGDPPATVLPLTAAGPVLLEQLTALSCRYDKGSASATAAHDTLAVTRPRMVTRCRLSLAHLEAAAATVKAAVDAHVHATKVAAEKELRAKLKAVDAQLDGLAVASNQLTCLAALARSTAASAASPAHLADVLCSLQRSRELCSPHGGPAVSTVCEVLCDPHAFCATALPTLSSLQLAVDMDKWQACRQHDSLVIEGNAVPSAAALDRTLRFTPRDSSDNIVYGLVPEDILVSRAEPHSHECTDAAAAVLTPAVSVDSDTGAVTVAVPEGWPALSLNVAGSHVSVTMQKVKFSCTLPAPEDAPAGLRRTADGLVLCTLAVEPTLTVAALKNALVGMRLLVSTDARLMLFNKLVIGAADCELDSGATVGSYTGRVVGVPPPPADGSFYLHVSCMLYPGPQAFVVPCTPACTLGELKQLLVDRALVVAHPESLVLHYPAKQKRLDDDDFTLAQLSIPMGGCLLVTVRLRGG